MRPPALLRPALVAALLGGALLSCDRSKPPARDDAESPLTKLKDPDPVVRLSAATRLAQSPGLAKGAVPDLVQALRDENAEVRYMAASALRVLHAEDRETLEALIRALQDPVAKVRAASAKALRIAAASALDLFPVLLGSLGDEDSEVRRYVGEAFQAHRVQAEPLLLGALDQPNALLRDSAAGLLFHESRDPLSRLIDLGLKHLDPRFRTAAAAALGRMGADAAPAVSALMLATKDEHLPLRVKAIQALGQIGPGAKDAVDLLRALAGQEQYRFGAEVALTQILKVEPPSNGPPERVDVGKSFRKFDGVRCPLPGEWPGFRGPNHDNIVAEKVPLADHWPPEGPPVLWTIALGDGYAGPAVSDGRVYVSDYDPKVGEESLRCFSLDAGAEIWRRSHKVRTLNNHGFTRSVPAVFGKSVVSIGPKCHVMCLNSETGALKWGLDLLRDYGTQLPDWYSGQCPLIDGSTVVLAPCGTQDLLVGIDCDTGRVKWRTLNTAKLMMSHSSVVPMTLNGKRMYVYVGEWGRLVGVSAEGDDAGRLLWETTTVEKQIMIPSPLVLEDGLIFLTVSYQGGSVMLQVLQEGKSYRVRTLWKLENPEGMSSELQTPIYYKKHIFGLAPDTMGALKQQMLCIDPFDKGRIVWSSGKGKRFGQYEAYLVADDKLLVLDKDGFLVLVKASVEKYEELARAKVYKGYEAWAPMALVGGRLILRDSRQMICLNLAE